MPHYDSIPKASAKPRDGKEEPEEEKNGSPRVDAPDKRGCGLSSDGNAGCVGSDPVTGQPVRSVELVKATPAEVDEYLKRYNELDGEESGSAMGAGDTSPSPGEGGVDRVTKNGGVSDGKDKLGSTLERE